MWQLLKKRDHSLPVTKRFRKQLYRELAYLKGQQIIDPVFAEEQCTSVSIARVQSALAALDARAEGRSLTDQQRTALRGVVADLRRLRKFKEMA